MQLNTPIGRLRLVAYLEGISYLLLAVTMPVKYMLDIPQPNFIVGMAHGWLFIIYIALCIQNTMVHRWGAKVSLLAMAAAFFPFATFYADEKLFKPQALKD